MTVGRKACLVNAINMLHEILDFVTIFIRQTITCSIRNVYYSSTRLDNSLYDTSQILIISTACILSIELYVLNILFSILDSSYSTFDDFLAGRIELILDMTVAGTDTSMDSLMLGILQSLSSTINIFSTARVSAQIVGQVTALEISTTELKSPGLDIGNPASITSTPNC